MAFKIIISDPTNRNYASVVNGFIMEHYDAIHNDDSFFEAGTFAGSFARASTGRSQKGPGQIRTLRQLKLMVVGIME